PKTTYASGLCPFLLQNGCCLRWLFKRMCSACNSVSTNSSPSITRLVPESPDPHLGRLSLSGGILHHEMDGFWFNPYHNYYALVSTGYAPSNSGTGDAFAAVVSLLICRN